MIGEQGDNPFSALSKVSQSARVDTQHPVFGLKRDLIRLLANMAYQNTVNQDKVLVISLLVYYACSASHVRPQKSYDLSVTSNVRPKKKVTVVSHYYDTAGIRKRYHNIQTIEISSINF